jgi:hypothetical protein
MAKSVSYAVSSRETNIIQRAFRPEACYMVEGDTAYDTDFAMFHTLYRIFKQESIQGRGTIKGRGMMKGRGMIKGRHLALYQIFKTTVFTTKCMIKHFYQRTY